MSGLIDRQKLEEAFGPDTAREILDLFVVNVGDTLDKLQAAIAEGDNVVGAARAHELYGTASAVGSDLMAVGARQLEIMLMSGMDPRAVDVLARLQQLFGEVKRVLSESSTH